MSRIYLSPPDVGEHERAMLLDAFDSGWIAPLGPHVDAFESEIADRTGRGHAAALSSGTAALHLALMILGVDRGDVVLTSTLTFAATANAVTYVGAIPAFIDTDETTWQMDPDLLAEELEVRARTGSLPKAVIVVDLYGQCADYDRILDTCNGFDIPVIEDAAESLGATYRSRSAGSFGAMGVVSFNGNKIITTSGGGMLVTDNGEWAERARFLATQARDDAPHYQHSTVGYNYRLSNLLAAVGRAQLGSLDERVAKRRAVFDGYQTELADRPGVAFMPEADYGTSNRWLTCMTVDPEVAGVGREDLRLRLLEEDIEARPVWKPMHLQPVFRECAVVGGTVSERLFDLGLCLPSGSTLQPAEQDRVIDIVAGCLDG